MKIERLHTGPLGTNTYILYDGGDDTCAVIDPADAAPVLAFLQKEGLRCTHILLTHGHFDHILGVAALKEKTGARVYIHAADAEALADPKSSLARMSYCEQTPCTADVLLQDGDTVEAAGCTLRVLHTPGHTPGGVCYAIDAPQKVVFVGDTIFRRSVGRCDFPGGSPYTLHASILEKLFTLPGDYRLCPGHEEETTLGEERAENPYVTKWGPDQW